jgi:anti-sigma B factor antagonist
MGGSWRKIPLFCGSDRRPFQLLLANAAFCTLDSESVPEVSKLRGALTACLRGWYLLVVTVDSSIQVGVSGPTVWVKVEGKGSFLNSGNLKEFAREMLDRGYREFVVDLADCAMMDSTFMGTMASVALRLRELGHGHLHIVHCGNRSQELLSGLGLDQIFDIRGNGASPPECGALERTPAVRSPQERKKEQTETMLAAHEALCEAAPENILRFKDVLDFLRQDLHHETPSK